MFNVKLIVVNTLLIMLITQWGSYKSVFNT